jgi:hypothetical protein
MPLSAKAAFEKWNRKIHFYLGLFFIFFLWLFLLSGLMLNHGDWSISRAAIQRREARYERQVVLPAETTDIDRARDLMRQLNLKGEPDVPASQTPGFFAFQVGQPRDASQVKVDLAAGRASVDHFTNSGLAVFRIFHTFSGSKYNQPETHRDWILTTIWVVAMDALAIGLVVMVLGSYYMWYRLKQTHTLGWIALASGFASCAMFFAGLLQRF